MLNLSVRRPAIFSLTAVLIFTLPWLNPFAPGPSPAVAPWLFSMAMAAVLMLFFAWGRHAQHESFGSLDAEITLAFALSLLVAGIVSSVLALLQYFGVEALFGPWVSRAEPGQAFANLRQRNQFASLTNIALAALLVLQVRKADRRVDESRGFMLLALAAAALLAVGNAASSSRTGLMQLLLLCGLFCMWGHWRNRRVLYTLMAAIVVYAVAMVALPWLSGADLSVQGMLARLRAGDSICASRITLWSNVLHLIAQKPWLGWGWRELAYAHYITLYEGPRFCDILDNAHNLPLHLAVELGIPAALLVCGALLWWVCRQRPWSESHPTRQLAWAVLALIGLHSLLEYPLWYGPFQLAVGLCIYLLWLNPRESVEADKPAKTSKYASNRALAPYLWASIATILIVICSYAAWDYHRISQIYLATGARDAAYRDDTLAKIQNSRLFHNQVLFAELSLTPLSLENAQWTFDTASKLLHFSPEPKVIEKLIESATLLGDEKTAVFHLARFRAAFPQDFQKWSERNKQLDTMLQAL